jgi:hypothetical protein
MKSLEFFPAEQVFFYVPQMVQALRYDKAGTVSKTYCLGYVERYILDTARSSQLFAHQIIWNMNANMFKDGDAREVHLSIAKLIFSRMPLNRGWKTLYKRLFTLYLVPIKSSMRGNSVSLMMLREFQANSNHTLQRARQRKR